MRQNDSDHVRVLKITSSYPRTPNDTAAVFLRYLAQGLHKQRVVVHVLAPADWTSGFATENGIEITRFRYFPQRWQQLAYGSGMLPNLRSNPLLWVSVPFYLLALFTKTLFLAYRLRPDILHAHWVLPQGLVAVLVNKLTGVPVVVTTHGGDAFGLKHPILRALKHFVLKNATTWTANTTATAQALADPNTLTRANIIPMGVDVRRFGSGQREQLRKINNGGADYLILYVGRLVEKKGVDDLIRAYALLDAELQKRSRLWIVGDGDCRAVLQELAQRLLISSRIRFWGQVRNENLPDFYAAADLFVAPSVVAASGDTEGQGVVLLEAFASRLCVLATRVGGISEVVEDGRTGVLVEPRNPEKLAEVMAALLRDSPTRERYARAGYDQVKETYDWERIVGEFAALYRRTITLSGSHIR